LDGENIPLAVLSGKIKVTTCWVMTESELHELNLRPYSEGKLKLQCPLKTLEFPKVPFSTASCVNETNHQNQGLIVTFALTSIFAGIFDIKHYFHLQVSETPGIVL
jgi:hypothetical protein